MPGATSSVLATSAFLGRYFWPPLWLMSWFRCAYVAPGADHSSIIVHPLCKRVPYCKHLWEIDFGIVHSRAKVHGNNPQLFQECLKWPASCILCSCKFLNSASDLPKESGQGWLVSTTLRSFTGPLPMKTTPVPWSLTKCLTIERPRAMRPKFLICWSVDPSVDPVSLISAEAIRELTPTTCRH